MAVLVFTALLTHDSRTKALCFQALELFAVWPLFTTGVVCLISGGVLGLGSKYRLVRYWWVAAKLVLNLLLTGLVLLALAPEVSQAAAQGRQFAAGQPATLAVGDLIYPPHRVPHGPARGDGARRVQTVGTHPQIHDQLTQVERPVKGRL